MLSMKGNAMLLGQNVGYLVDQQKVCSRLDLANALGVSEQAIGQLITGKTKGLKPLHLIAASDKLGVSARDIVMHDLRATARQIRPYQKTEIRETVLSSEANELIELITELDARISDKSVWTAMLPVVRAFRIR